MEVTSILSIIFDSVSFFTRDRTAETINSVAVKHLEDAYGKTPARLLRAISPNVFDTFQIIYQIAYYRDNDRALAFKSFYLSDCNMTSVAGTILAQIAISALSLPYLSQTHWVSRAFFIAAFVSGCFSVYAAVTLQRTIGRLYDPQDIITWIMGSGQAPHNSQSQVPIIARKNLKVLFSILFAAQMLSAPPALVNVSLSAFLMGLSIYLGFIWTRNLDEAAGVNDSRNVFITFIVCASVFLGMYTVPTAMKGQSHRETFGSNMLTYEDSWIKISDILLPSEEKSQAIQEKSHQVVLNDIKDTSLISALEKAVSAHEKCAEADKLVAAEYARLLNSVNTKPFPTGV